MRSSPLHTTLPLLVAAIASGSALTKPDVGAAKFAADLITGVKDGTTQIPPTTIPDGMVQGILTEFGQAVGRVKRVSEHRNTNADDFKSVMANLVRARDFLGSLVNRPASPRSVNNGGHTQDPATGNRP